MRTCCASDDHKPHLENCPKEPALPLIRVLSFGAGTQSSAVLGLIEEGRLPPVDFAVFADTQCEPDEVYRWLEKITAWAKRTRIIVATKGNLMEDSLRAAGGAGMRIASLPLYTSGLRERAEPAEGTEFDAVPTVEPEEGMIRRQCTKEYKIDVVHQAVRRELGYIPRQRMKHKCEMLIAMSLEETIRMRDSREKWITNKYPLIFDVPMHRQQSIDYVASFGLGPPPRSSCMMCPFRSNSEWRHLREAEPHNFAKVLAFDDSIRELPRMHSQTFLHRSCKPLREVDLDTQSDQLDFFLNECEGMCGA